MYIKKKDTILRCQFEFRILPDPDNDSLSAGPTCIEGKEIARMWDKGECVEGIRMERKRELKNEENYFKSLINNWLLRLLQ